MIMSSRLRSWLAKRRYLAHLECSCFLSVCTTQLPTSSLLTMLKYLSIGFLVVTGTNLACSSCSYKELLILVCRIVSIDMLMSEFDVEGKCVLILTCLINFSAASVTKSCFNLLGHGTKLRPKQSPKLSSYKI